MKKLYSTPNYKRKNRIHALNSLRGQIRFKLYKTNKNRVNNKRTTPERKSTKDKYKDYDLVNAKVPSNFSFLDNPVEVIKFITDLKRLFDAKRKVFILMKNIKVIDYSAIVVLLSIMVRFKSQNIRFNGDFPKDRRIKNILIASGFFQTLFKITIKDRDRYNLGNKNTIHTHAWRNVDSELGQTIMKDVSVKILGCEAVYKGLQRTLVELMQNSFNHATPSKEGEKHWWLSVNVSEKQKVASFSFIDYGIGIFESLNGKTTESKWFNWKTKLRNLFSSDNNAEVLKLILDGELHKTVTGKHYRGKGLPGIKEAMDRNLISNLHIITNNVYANVCENKYQILPHNFGGTFVYWEVNEQTINTPWIH
ncbi:MAG TPA: hypothetical protein VK668_20350 [Mucilaginibacter sp.]|nr:hypothetical protein [Mucilaginibacter sp.]